VNYTGVIGNARLTSSQPFAETAFSKLDGHRSNGFGTAPDDRRGQVHNIDDYAVFQSEHQGGRLFEFEPRWKLRVDADLVENDTHTVTVSTHQRVAVDRRQPPANLGWRRCLGEPELLDHCESALGSERCDGVLTAHERTRQDPVDGQPVEMFDQRKRLADSVSIERPSAIVAAPGRSIASERMTQHDKCQHDVMSPKAPDQG
jgi:hypothetical protein